MIEPATSLTRARIDYTSKPLLTSHVPYRRLEKERLNAS
jgi:hypothetical protein